MILGSTSPFPSATIRAASIISDSRSKAIVNCAICALALEIIPVYGQDGDVPAAAAACC